MTDNEKLLRRRIRKMVLEIRDLRRQLFSHPVAHGTPTWIPSPDVDSGYRIVAKTPDARDCW